MSVHISRSTYIYIYESNMICIYRHTFESDDGMRSLEFGARGLALSSSAFLGECEGDSTLSHPYKQLRLEFGYCPNPLTVG